MPILAALQLLIRVGPTAWSAYREISTFIDELQASGQHADAAAAEAKRAALVALPRAQAKAAIVNHRDEMAYQSLMLAGEPGNDQNEA